MIQITNGNTSPMESDTATSPLNYSAPAAELARRVDRIEFEPTDDGVNVWIPPAPRAMRLITICIFIAIALAAAVVTGAMMIAGLRITILFFALSIALFGALIARLARVWRYGNQAIQLSIGRHRIAFEDPVERGKTRAATSATKVRGVEIMSTWRPINRRVVFVTIKWSGGRESTISFPAHDREAINRIAIEFAKCGYRTSCDRKLIPIPSDPSGR